MNRHLYLALTHGKNFGWGVCSHYLTRELKKIYPQTHVIENDPQTIQGTVFHALADLDFNPLYKVRGTNNFGYTFFENELTSNSISNSATYDCILAGSTWCRQKLLEKGVENSEILIQGIDPDLFFPLPEKTDHNLFVLFSGGKFELRKGQDIVLHAFRILQDKYDDLILINCWYNSWPESMALLEHSRHITFDVKGDTWKDFMKNIYLKNGIDPDRVITLDLVDNQQLRDLYAKTDLGIFPNRCEGGTNLVLMEYMACAKPVVASLTSGHADILTGENALLLDDLTPYPVYDHNGNLWADWQEPSVEQLVAHIEYAYTHRKEMQKIGTRAGQDMKSLTWADSARSLLGTLRKYDAVS